MNKDSKMKVELWSGGLQPQEIDAIEKIEKKFSGTGEMFPWKGYAGFRFIDSKGYEGEFDLVIITHCNVIIVELKDWNNGEITLKNDKWHKNDREMQRSPVSITRDKTFLLENKFEKIKHKLTNKGYKPFVHFVVVMSGNANFSKLPESQKNHTLSLKKFLNLSNKNEFEKYFFPKKDLRFITKKSKLNQDFIVFDNLFLDNNNTAPKKVRVSGYMPNDEAFSHPKNIYTEFYATTESSKDANLLRIWDFNKIDNAKVKTPGGRVEIVSRERKILEDIKNYNLDIYNNCLTSLTTLQPEDVTNEYGEVYELKPGHIRFNEFIGKYGENLTEVNRINLIKLLVAKFSDLHEIKISHNDLGNHSIWLSSGKKIALSNFMCGNSKSLKPLGDLVEFLPVGDFSDIVDLSSYQFKSPYQYDVKILGIVCWHILTAQRISNKSISNLLESAYESKNWCATILLNAIEEDIYKNAGDLLNAIKEKEPDNKNTFEFDTSELDKYRKDINHIRQYREDGDFIIETNDEESYFTNGLLLKSWLNINPSNENPNLGYKVLRFLQKVEDLSLISPKYLPKVVDFGIATKSSSLYLVSEIPSGTPLKDKELSVFEKFNLISVLIDSVEHMHNLNISHGRLIPDNVLICGDEEDRYILLRDILNFSDSVEQTYITDDSIIGKDRDNYAVMKISCELLGITWGLDSIEYKGISESVQVELTDTGSGFKSLSRFKSALSELTIEDKHVLKIGIKSTDGFESITIYPDNGYLYVKVGKGRSGGIQITIFGLGGKVTLFYDAEYKYFYAGLPPKNYSIKPNDINSSHFKLDYPIEITSAPLYDIKLLSEDIVKIDAFNRAVEDILVENNDVQDKSVDVITDAVIDTHKPVQINEEEIEISAAKLWKAILNTELESAPNIKIDGDIDYEHHDNGKYVVIPYNANTNVMDEFNKSDSVESYIVKNENEFFLGDINYRRCTSHEIFILNSRNTNQLKDGDTIYFRTKADYSSYEKRKSALQRIINNASVIGDLAGYFDSNCTKESTIYDAYITDDEFKRYDRKGEFDNTISLNSQQREAFQKLISSGPLSALQGPPGTGKTEFIAAFVHYLFEKENIKNILLVSQSHAAVDTAAERIRKHSVRLGTPLEIVRFSNNENKVLDSLRDVFSDSLITEKVELFKAEYKHRIESISHALGLQKEYVSSIVQAELKTFKLIDNYINEKKHINVNTDRGFDNKEKSILNKNLKELESHIRLSLKNDYEIQNYVDIDLSNSKKAVIERLNHIYSISSSEAKKAIALAKLSSDMIQKLEADRTEYEEFFTRSRQLVFGTCVGIGGYHLNISNTHFDWVIIDEAARSTASELAIAMQSGKRVLLVGDHKQLPPLYKNHAKSKLAMELGITTKDIELNNIYQSDFARLFESPYGKQVGVTLTTQYRMAPEIGDLVSDIFYDGELKNGGRSIPNIYQIAPIVFNSVVTWIDTSTLGSRSYHQQQSRGTSFFNNSEANIIVDLLKQVSQNSGFLASLTNLVKEDEPALGVICMYAEQKRVIQQKFRENIWTDEFKSLVKIDTVDSYQGKENRVIILSVTRCDKACSAGFLDTPNRINVALSRAMDRLIIVGSGAMWKKTNNKLPLGKTLNYIQNKGAHNNSYKIYGVNKDFSLMGDEYEL